MERFRVRRINTAPLKGPFLIFHLSFDDLNIATCPYIRGLQINMWKESGAVTSKGIGLGSLPAGRGSGRISWTICGRILGGIWPETEFPLLCAIVKDGLVW